MPVSGESSSFPSGHHASGSLIRQGTAPDSSSTADSANHSNRAPGGTAGGVRVETMTAGSGAIASAELAATP